jgi:DNA modification methylase
MKNWRVKLYQKDALELCNGLKDDSVDFFCCDPPYSNSIKAISSSDLKTGNREGTGYYRTMTPFILMSTKPFPDYIAELLAVQYAKLKPGGNIAVMMTEKNLYTLWNKIPDVLHYQTTLYWNRPSGSPHWAALADKHIVTVTWPILILSKGKKHYSDAKSAAKFLQLSKTAQGKIRKNVGNIWNVPIQRKYRYYTSKPTELMEALVTCYSPKGALVVDCFIGSGATAEATVKTGRRCIASDISDDSMESTKVRLLPYKVKL